MACADCFKGASHSGSVLGTESTLGGIPCYISAAHGAPDSSPETRPACLLLTDIFGWRFTNTRLLADRFAAAGFVCYVPDILQGDAISSPDSFDRSTFPAWRAHHGDAETLPPALAVASELRARHTAVYTIGYCFGARYAVLLAQAVKGAPGAVEAFAVAHPSFVTTSDIEAVRAPGLFLLAEVDSAFPEEAVAAARVAMAMTGLPHEFRGPYPGTVHGFAVRGSEDDPRVVAAREDALQGAIDFFRARGQ